MLNLILKFHFIRGILGKIVNILNLKTYQMGSQIGCNQKSIIFTLLCLYSDAMLCRQDLSSRS